MFGKSVWAEDRPIPRHLPVEAQGIQAERFMFQAEFEVTQTRYSTRTRPRHRVHCDRQVYAHLNHANCTLSMG
jgi:hypothetical protein